jgi:hypothetical protein
VAEGLTLLGPAKIAISEYLMVTSDWPKDNAAAGLADKHAIIGDYTEHVSVKNNVIDVKYGYAANPGIFDRQIELTGTHLCSGKISWICAAKTENGKGKGKGEFKLSYLPPSCR